MLSTRNTIFVSGRILFKVFLFFHCFHSVNTNDFPLSSAVELSHGNVLCVACGTYVYDDDLLKVAHELMVRAGHRLGMGALYRPWEPSAKVLELLRKNPRRRKIVPGVAIGNSSLFKSCHSFCFSHFTKFC